MKIVHINFTDKSGGAAIAAYRHHEAMRRTGVDSKMMVYVKSSDDPNVIVHRVNPIVNFSKRVFGRLFLILKPYYGTWSWNHYGFDFSNNKDVKEADIIILHWVNAYMLSIRGIEKILQLGKPVYWFMHDMWPITGGCHHSLDCDKYQTHCEACPMANNRHGTTKKHDLSWHQFEEKLKRLTPYSNLHFLTPSQWLAEKVKESALFGCHSVEVVRNVLNTEVFKPRNKEDARNRLGLPLVKKLILFGADNLKSIYKGWPLLRDALIDPIEGTEAVVYGLTPDGLQDEIGIKLHLMGHIKNEDSLVDLYSACDVFVTPSLADNYPNVLIEAMACGLPCIGTNIGGIPEIIDSYTGIVTKGNDSSTLRMELIEFLNRDDTEYRKQCVNKILRNNSYQHGLSEIFFKHTNEE